VFSAVIDCIFLSEYVDVFNRKYTEEKSKKTRPGERCKASDNDAPAGVTYSASKCPIMPTAMRWKHATLTAIVALRVQRINADWEVVALHPIVDDTQIGRQVAFLQKQVYNDKHF
jgi:hypothetical protein